MRSISARGCFIVLEGLDGAGTTTQAVRLGAELRRQGYRVLVTREPSAGPVGMLIRRILVGKARRANRSSRWPDQTLALLFAADRTDHLQGCILPALLRGEVVVCDRYLLSSLAYQGSTLPGRWVEAVNAWAMPPDLTLFLDVDPRTASIRRTARRKAPELFEKNRLQEQIARQYHVAFRKHQKSHHIVRLLGTKPIEDVTAEALREVRRALQKPRKPFRVTMQP